MRDMPMPMAMASPTPQPPKEDDFFGKVMKDPWFRLGMALLKEGGPQSKPHSVGQDISRAVETVQGQMDDDVIKADARQKAQMQSQMQQAALGQLGDLGNFGQPDMAPRQPPNPTMTPPGAFVPPPVANLITSGGNAGGAPQFRAGPVGKLRTSQIDELITKAAKEYGVDPLLYRSLVQTESGFRHIDPKTGRILTSPIKGALGAAQLMPGTAADMGVDPMDLEQNLRGGAKYLRQQIDAFGNTRDALRAYNAGPARARRNPRISTDYADTIMGRLPNGNYAAAPNEAPAPAAPPMQSPPPAPGGPSMAVPSIPPDLHKMFMWQALSVANGDPVKLFGEYNRLAYGWQQEQAKANRSSYDATSQAVLQDTLARQREADRFNRETAAAPGAEYDKKIATKDADRFITMQESAPTIEQTLSTLTDMKSLLKSGLSTGAGADALQQWKSGIKMLTGADIDVGKGDYFSALSVRQMKDIRAAYAAMGIKDPNPAVYDTQMDEKMSPSMRNSPEGNMLIIMQMERKARQALEIAQAASDFAASQPDKRFNSLSFERSPQYKAIGEKYRIKPSDFDNMSKVARMLLKGAPEVSSPEEAAALPSGTVFITPDGKIKRRP